MAELLKDIFFQKKFYDELCTEIKKEYKEFDQQKFFALLYDQNWEAKKLKERMKHTTSVLKETLPKDFEKAVDILIKIEKKFNGFEHLVFAEFVGEYGINDFKKSMQALGIFTRSSAEFAIRPFIIKYPKQTMEYMYKWSKSNDVNQRRLASEGSRPRLPWGQALNDFKKDPGAILPILEQLKNDPSEYVRRSVANNLNDISKDHPQLALKIANKWLGESSETDKLVKHALRTLLKQGNKDAMKLFKFDDAEGVLIKDPKIVPSKIKIGEKAKFSFTCTSKTEKLLRLEYKIHYVKSSAKTSGKVFQIREFVATSNTVYRFERNLAFKDLTTRKHHPGTHTLDLIVNGHTLASINFELVRQ